MHLNPQSTQHDRRLTCFLQDEGPISIATPPGPVVRRPIFLFPLFKSIFSYDVLYYFNGWLTSTIVCYTAVFSVVTQRGALRDDSKNGCVADYIHQSAGLNRRKTLWGRVLVVTATSFPGFSPTRPTEWERGRVEENPGNEVVVTAVNEGWQKN